MKLPKNNPEDVEFIKRAHQDPKWPPDLDKPCDWDQISLWEKVWFKVGDTVKMLTTVAAVMFLIIACHETFFDGAPDIGGPHCEQFTKSRFDY